MRVEAPYKDLASLSSEGISDIILVAQVSPLEWKYGQELCQGKSIGKMCRKWDVLSQSLI